MSLELVDTPHQILNQHGKVVAELPKLPDETLLGFYRWMLLGRTFSDRMVALQRQGQMGTFAPLTGPEAARGGIGAAREDEVWLCGSYRGSLAWGMGGGSGAGVRVGYRGGSDVEGR
jgi:pyruvate dehydrogenase E1 component alpha subunit